MTRLVHAPIPGPDLVKEARRTEPRALCRPNGDVVRTGLPRDFTVSEDPDDVSCGQCRRLTAILNAVRAQGSRVYNGRGARTIRTLEATGLVNVDWGSRAQAKGNSLEIVQVITVRPR